MSLERSLVISLRTYFGICPLCFSQNSMTATFGRVHGVKDYMSCTGCGAKWHIGMGKYAWNLARIQWAELVIDGVNKNGAPLMGKREKPEFWQHLALEGLRKMPPVPEEQKPTIIREKETIREVVLIPCSYCSGLMPQTAIFCPNCGARRKN